MLANCDVIVIFRIYIRFGPIHSIWTIFINSNLLQKLKAEIKTL